MTSTVAGASGRKMPPGTAALQLPPRLNATSQFVHTRCALKQPNRRDSGCACLETLRRVRHADSANRQNSNPNLAANFPQSLYSERCAKLHLRRRLKDGTENNVVRPFVSRSARLHQAMAGRPNHKTRHCRARSLVPLPPSHNFAHRQRFAPKMNSTRASSHGNIKSIVDDHSRSPSRRSHHSLARQFHKLLPAEILLPNLNPIHPSLDRITNPRKQSRHTLDLRLRTSGIRTKPVTIGDIAKNPRLSGARQWPSPAAGTSPQPGWHPPIPARKSPLANMDSKGRESIQESGSGSNSSPSSQTRAPTRVVTRVPATGVAG